jgi:hypothetical protein
LDLDLKVGTAWDPQSDQWERGPQWGWAVELPAQVPSGWDSGLRADFPPSDQDLPLR